MQRNSEGVAMTTNVFRLGGFSTVRWVHYEDQKEAVRESESKIRVSDVATLSTAHQQLLQDNCITTLRSCTDKPEASGLWIFQAAASEGSTVRLKHQCCQHLKVVEEGIWQPGEGPHNLTLLFLEALQQAAHSSLTAAGYHRFGRRFIKCPTSIRVEGLPALELQFQPTSAGIDIQALLVTVRSVRPLSHMAGSPAGQTVFVSGQEVAGRLLGSCPTELVQRLYPQRAQERGAHYVQVALPGHTCPLLVDRKECLLMPAVARAREDRVQGKQEATAVESKEWGEEADVPAPPTNPQQLALLPPPAKKRRISSGSWEGDREGERGLQSWRPGGSVGALQPASCMDWDWLEGYREALGTRWQSEEATGAADDLNLDVDLDAFLEGGEVEAYEFPTPEDLDALPGTAAHRASERIRWQRAQQRADRMRRGVVQNARALCCPSYITSEVALPLFIPTTAWTCGWGGGRGVDRGELIPVVEEQPTKKVGEGEAAVDVPVSEGEEDAVIPLLKECETPSLWTLPDPPSLTLLLEQLVPTCDRGMERAFKALEVQSQERGLQDTTGVEQVLDTCHSPMSPTRALSLLTSEVGPALSAAFGRGNVEGPLTAVQWCSPTVSWEPLGAPLQDVEGGPITPPQGCNSPALSAGPPVGEEGASPLSQPLPPDPLPEEGGDPPALLTLPPPAVMVGYQDDCLLAAPSLLELWEKAPLEPYSPPKPVEYDVVCPGEEAVMSAAGAFMQQLCTMYETCNLGTHTAAATPGDGLTPPFPGMLTCGGLDYCEDIRQWCLQLKARGGSRGGVALQEGDGEPCTVLYVVCPWEEPLAVLDLLMDAAVAVGEGGGGGMTVHILPLHSLPTAHPVRLAELARCVYTKIRRRVGGLRSADQTPTPPALSVGAGWKDCSTRSTSSCKATPTAVVGLGALFEPAFILGSMGGSAQAGLHCCYGWAGPHLLSVWTDTRGELLEVYVLPGAAEGLGGMEGALRSVLDQGLTLQKTPVRGAGQLAITRLGSIPAVEVEGWQSALAFLSVTLGVSYAFPPTTRPLPSLLGLAAASSPSPASPLLTEEVGRDGLSSICIMALSPSLPLQVLGVPKTTSAAAVLLTPHHAAWGADTCPTETHPVSTAVVVPLREAPGFSLSLALLYASSKNAPSPRKLVHHVAAELAALASPQLSSCPSGLPLHVMLLERGKALLRHFATRPAPAPAPAPS